MHRTVRCAVPLEAILDVSTASAPNDGSGGGGEGRISHESTAVPVYVSATGGSLRRGGRTEAATEAAAAGGTGKGQAPHLAQDRFTTVSATCTTGPLSLAALQRFLQRGLPRGLVRMKGVLWIAHAEKARARDLRTCPAHVTSRAVDRARRAALRLPRGAHDLQRRLRGGVGQGGAARE